MATTKAPAKPKKLENSFLPAVDVYINKSQPFAQPILTHLRALIHKAAPTVVEEIKWSRPFFLYNGIILGNISAFKEHCSLGLWGSEMATELRKDGILSGAAMGSFGRITSVKDLPPAAKLTAYIKNAAKLIDEGTRTKSINRPQQRVAKPPAEVPDTLATAFKKNKAAAKIFDTMSPSCRREYIDWINAAKREETRATRVATTIAWVAEGKSRNWKYESC